MERRPSPCSSDTPHGRGRSLSMDSGCAKRESTGASAMPCAASERAHVTASNRLRARHVSILEGMAGDCVGSMPGECAPAHVQGNTRRVGLACSGHQRPAAKTRANGQEHGGRCMMLVPRRTHTGACARPRAASGPRTRRPPTACGSATWRTRCCQASACRRTRPPNATCAASGVATLFSHGSS